MLPQLLLAHSAKGNLQNKTVEIVVANGGGAWETWASAKIVMMWLRAVMQLSTTPSRAITLARVGVSARASRLDLVTSSRARAFLEAATKRSLLSFCTGLEHLVPWLGSEHIQHHSCLHMVHVMWSQRSLGHSVGNVRENRMQL